MATKKKDEQPVEQAETQEPRFAKSQLIRAERFEKDTDIVRAVLVDDVEYTIAETEVLIDKFKKGKVT